MGNGTGRVACLWLFVVLAEPAPAGAAEVRVDCSIPCGEIRPLHGANCGPVNYGDTVDLSAYHRELGIPFTRLHDCHWPNPDVVDVHVVFPDFRADPEKPESYDFSRTDDYIQSIVSTGSRIVYRLGESIEHTKKQHHVHPPADPEKWAAACAGIIRHYNDDWANGFRHGIRYWEIWNEPENRPNMWTGSDADYFQLYVAASKAIKARFPGLLVGGPSIGYAGVLTDGSLKPTPFLEGFLDHCRRSAAPLDFFSWHRYADDPFTFVHLARAIRRLLDERGFTKTESHLNEWNYLPGENWTPILLSGQGMPRQRCYEEIGGAPGAAFAACALICLQDSPVDVANYYTADHQGFGLFSAYGVPKKTFFAFKAFKILLDAPLRVDARGGVPGRLAACAGVNRDRTQATVLISNFRSPDDRIGLTMKNLPWNGPATYEVLVVDAEHDLKQVRQGDLPASEFKLALDLKAPSVVLIKLGNESAGK